jgi:hypothetical protein
VLPHAGTAYASIRQHTSAYVSIRQHTSADGTWYSALRGSVAWRSSSSTRSWQASTYVSIRQRTSAYVSGYLAALQLGPGRRVRVSICTFVLVKRQYLHFCTSKASKQKLRRIYLAAYLRRQHTSAYVSIRQRIPGSLSEKRCLQAPTYVSIRQRTSAYVSGYLAVYLRSVVCRRQHTSAYVSIRQHTSADTWQFI